MLLYFNFSQIKFGVFLVPTSVKKISLRAVILGLLLNTVFTVVNSYLGINFGLGFSYTLITLMFVYVLFHKRGGSSPSEALIAILASTGFFMVGILAVASYIQAYEPNSNLPSWFVPPRDVLLNGSMFDGAWIVPILVHFFITFSAISLGLLISLSVADLVMEDKRLKFPFAKVTSIVIKTFFEKETRISLILKWILIGFALTLIQNLLKVFGIETLNLDFTPILPYGYSFGIFLNLGIIAISYIIEPSMTLTLLIAGMIYYFLIAPQLVKYGVFEPSNNAYGYYMNMLFQFSISPGLGAFILSAPIILIVRVLKTRLRKLETKVSREGSDVNAEGESKGLNVEGYGSREANLMNFIAEMFTNFVKNPLMGLLYFGLVSAYLVFVVVFGIFNPLPMYMAVLLGILFLIPIGIIDCFILIRMMGEIGMTFGAHRLAMYEGVIYTSGYRGYLGYLAYPVSDPWMSSSLIYWFKIGEDVGAERRHILIVFIIRLIVVYFLSVLFFLFAWYTYGIPSEFMPSISIIQWFAIVKIFVSGGASTLFNPLSFLVGGIIAGILGALTPVSPIGIALTLFLPSTYIIPLGLGGVFRVYTDRKYGKKWYDEKGQYIATGFFMGSILTQIFFSILIFV